jgi:hypothetical protein
VLLARLLAERLSNFAKAALLNWVCELLNSYVQCATVPRPSLVVGSRGSTDDET